MEIKATIVFEKNWNAAHKLDIFGNRKYKNIINSGSSRSSKTHSLIQMMYLYAYMNPNKKIGVFRDTKANCKKTVFEDMKRIYQEMPHFKDFVTLDKTNSIWRFKNGSTILIEGTDDPEKVMGYHSDVIWLNEPYGISKETFDQLAMRCSDFVIIDMNPKVNHWSDDVVRQEDSYRIHSTWRDNPYCPYQQKQYIKSYKPLSRSFVVIDKLIDIGDAFVYDINSNTRNFDEVQLMDLILCIKNEREKTADDYMYDVYSEGVKGEINGRIYKFKECEYMQYLNMNTEVYYGVDWGLSDPLAVVELKIFDGGIYLHEMNYKSENDIREKLTVHDQMQINHTDEEGLVTWLFNKLGIRHDKLIVCDSNRPSKILQLRNTGWENSISCGGKSKLIDRITNLKGLNIYYTSTSVNLRYEQENYAYKKDRYGINLEKPEGGNDHCLNAAEYLIEKLIQEGIIKQR